MKRAVILRHLSFEDLDALEPVLKIHGYDIHYCDVPLVKNLKQEINTADLLIVLGGPIGVYQNEIFPFLDKEISLIKEWILAERPILGICLGAQMIAKALGANVYPGNAGKELGWSYLKISEDGIHSPIARLNEVKVLHWHGDTFDLPEGSKLLASTDLYKHQAFSYGKKVLAFQFHIEASSTGLERWYVGHIGELASIPELDINTLREQSAIYGPIVNARLKEIFASYLLNI